MYLNDDNVIEAQQQQHGFNKPLKELLWHRGWNKNTGKQRNHTNYFAFMISF